MNRPLNKEDGLAKILAADRPALASMAVHQFRKPGGTEPAVMLLACGEARVVLKDYGMRSGWFARLLGPILIGREAAALQRLDGLRGVPRLLRRIDRRGVLMEYVPAQPWGRVRPGALAFERLDVLVAAMHARGVAHCDMRAPSNILVDEHEQPYVVDFVARVLRGSSMNLVWNWIFRKFCQTDRNALAKLKVRFAPDLASEDERLRAQHRGAFTRFARGVGSRLRDVTRLLVSDNSR